MRNRPMQDEASRPRPHTLPRWRWRWLLGCAAGALASAAALVAGCGKAVTAPHFGSETHFLDACGSEGCGDGLQCIDGLCTLGCQSDSECTALAASALCWQAGSASACQRPCDGDDECTADNPNWTCSAGRCGAWALAAAPASAAEPVGAGLPAACPAQPEATAIEPFEVSTSVSRVPGPRSVVGAVADGTGLYWMETDGSLMSLPRGSNMSIVLRPPTIMLNSLVSLVSDSANVYWDDLMAPPPAGAEAASTQGLLYRLAKSGGEPELLLRMNGALRPISASGSAVLLVAGGEELYSLEAQSLRRVDAVPVSTGVQIRDGLAYWALDAADSSASEVFSGPLSGGPSRRLGQLPYGVQFLVGKDLVLARRRRLVTTEPQRWVESLVRLDTLTGCTLELPGLDQGIGSMVVDDRHVYWRSVNLYTGATPLDAPPELALVRMDLQSLRIERLVSPDLEPSLNHDFVAQDEEQLYLRVDGLGPLLAVRKPG